MARPNLTITTPRGTVFTVALKNGSAKAVLEWKPGFGREYTGNFTQAQLFVDNEVLRFCSARVPFDTGMLQKSGILGTEVGSGEVRYIAPYSRRLYYNPQYNFQGAPMRGAYWFERGKAVERERILQGAKRLAGGGK